MSFTAGETFRATGRAWLMFGYKTAQRLLLKWPSMTQPKVPNCCLWPSGLVLFLIMAKVSCFRAVTTWYEAEPLNILRSFELHQVCESQFDRMYPNTQIGVHNLYISRRALYNVQFVYKHIWFFIGIHMLNVYMLGRQYLNIDII